MQQLKLIEMEKIMPNGKFTADFDDKMFHSKTPTQIASLLRTRWYKTKSFDIHPDHEKHVFRVKIDHDGEEIIVTKLSFASSYVVAKIWESGIDIKEGFITEELIDLTGALWNMFSKQQILMELPS